MALQPAPKPPPIVSPRDVEPMQQPTSWFIYFLTGLAMLSPMQLGYDMGISSGAIFSVQHTIELSDLWKQLIIAGSLPLAAFTSIVAAYVSDSIGRKKTVIICGVNYFIGSIVIASAVNKYMLFCGRLIIGSGLGFTGASTAVYIAECAPVNIRGKLLGMNQPFLTSGILVATLIAELFSYDIKNGWRYMWAFQGIFSVIQLPGMLFMPESPRWLIQKDRLNQGRDALIRLRNFHNVDAEVYEIKSDCEAMERANEKTGDCQVFVNMMKTPSVRRALLVGCGIHVFAQFSGSNTIIYYTGIIIKMAGVDDDNTAIRNSVMVNCITLIFAIIGVWLVDVVGRRKLLILGLMGLGFSTACLGTTFLMTSKYSPAIDTTVGFANTSCGIYSVCDGCVHDPNCGFCYIYNGSKTRGTCLPTNLNYSMTSDMEAHSMKWVTGYCPLSFSWVAVVGLALFLLFYAPSIGPLPWTINAEIYPLWARSTGNGLGGATCWLCISINAVTFLSLGKAIHNYGVFYLFSFIAISGSLLFYLLLPEMKGKSLEEVESSFVARKNVKLFEKD